MDAKGFSGAFRILKSSYFVTAAAAASLSSFALAGTVRGQEPVVHVYGPCGPAPAMRDVALAFQTLYWNARCTCFGSGGPMEGNCSPGRRRHLQRIEKHDDGFRYATPRPHRGAPSIVPAYFRSAAILVQPGNPRHIGGLRDLFKPGIRVMIVQGAGQTGMWEDLAGRDPHALQHLRELRTNIVSFASNSAEALATWTGENPPEAWIIYNIWQIALTTRSAFKRPVKSILRCRPL